MDIDNAILELRKRDIEIINTADYKYIAFRVDPKDSNKIIAYCLLHADENIEELLNLEKSADEDDQ
jgi:hypothetical protein